MSTAAQRLAKAIAKAGSEHGTPNGISPGELSADFTSLTPMQIGVVLRHHRPALDAHLLGLGYRITDYSDAGAGYGKRIGFDAA